jgi:hydroxymethylpyrimidine/phosphomethylpyrimidine kinase
MRLHDNAGGVKPARLLIVAGSDSGGGAGIQADIKTASAFGVYAMTAIAAVTVQDTTGVYGVHTIPTDIVRDQIAHSLGDIGADAIKIGMLGTADVISAVASVLTETAKGIPLVLDPVMIAKGGAPLLARDAVERLKSELIPLAYLVTPNLPEAHALTGIAPENEKQARMAGEKFFALGARAALFKGGHGMGAVVRDFLVEADGNFTVFEQTRQDTVHTHGTGCTLSSAIACGLAQGFALKAAVGRAHAYVQEAIRTAPGFGHGHGPLNHLITPKP